MPTFDLEDNDNFSLTTLDTYRIEDLGIGEILEGEAGNFKVKRTKNSYELYIRNESLIRKHQTLQMTFPTLKRLIGFLKK